MKRGFVIVPAALCGMAATAFWINRSTTPMPDVPPPAVAAIPAKIATTPIAPSRSTVRSVEIIEPILVLPEVEVAPMPEMVVGPIAANAKVDDFGFGVSKSPAARPEARSGERPWMPYAKEDRALSDSRRLEWAKFAVNDAEGRRLDNFEESEEPPLLEKK